MTLTLNREFLHTVFSLLPAEEKLLFIFTSVAFLYTVAKYIYKKLLQNTRKSIFPQFENCQNLHILTVTC